LSAAGPAFDAAILDVMLPGRDGFSVVSELRRQGDFIPILMLTARGRPEDVLQGFEAGADDYLPKPFELAILMARLRGLLRRSAWTRQKADAAGEAAAEVLTFAGKTLDLTNLELRVRGNSYHLTVMEADLLRYFIRNAGKAVSRKAILEDVWDLHEDTDTRAIDNFIVRLRRYIEDDPSKPRHVLTVRGVGYKFIESPV
jgi:DNA-binding response OmpR family regulator